MKDRVTAKIEYLQRELDSLKKLLGDENVLPMAELVKAAFDIDDHYKRWCEDHYEGENVYEDGTCIEFYLESLDVHALSLAARKIRASMYPEKEG